jgi:hypothetical protein
MPPEFMGTKLVKLEVPDSLHRRIKTVAASKDASIPDYMLEVLEDEVPTGIDFLPSGETTYKKKPKGEKLGH